MVIVKLNGGLGNQMFQYAAGRMLSIHHQTALKLDIAALAQDPLRNYNLGPFNIRPTFATTEEINHLKGTPDGLVLQKISALKQKIIPSIRQTVFYEAHIGPFNENILKTPRDVYLDGYWQSEKYFLDIENVIRDEFTIGLEQDLQSRDIAEVINETNSVSIHVRRGDYVSNPITYRVHGVCGLDYYTRCIELIAEKARDPHFFVFSDDPAWVSENLRFDYPMIFVTHNCGIRDYEDLRLMNSCKHHIIANSSFSWWGAWLSNSPGKLVFAPKRWFNISEPDTSDLLPSSWIRV